MTASSVWWCRSSHASSPSWRLRSGRCTGPPPSSVGSSPMTDPPHPSSPVIPLAREHGFRFVRLDGSMSSKRRTQVIQEFQSSAADSPTVMLLSLKAGGVGLNLTAASHVFLMDPVRKSHYPTLVAPYSRFVPCCQTGQQRTQAKPRFPNQLLPLREFSTLPLGEKFKGKDDL